MEPLSRRQQEILSLITDCLATQGRAPSARDIAERLEFPSQQAVVQHLTALERKGYIRRSGGRSASISLCNGSTARQQECLPGVDWDHCYFQLPVVEQTEPGMQEPDPEQTVEQVSLDRFGRMSGARFMLRVQGDAMRGAGIVEGDLALVRPSSSDTSTGDIVVVHLHGETMVRRCLHEQGFIRLQPENPAFDPIFVRHGAPGFHIIGVVTGIFRMQEAGKIW
ncbi:transcriptional repressor LexA [Trichlorobacter ammonificans]|uniref:LexA repressor n=1 Tax=Trichlorobacter ammonificans TaxID=2916410 RepID=A0ABM9DBC4_9BACT|nr:transcriptional repressor LexA [Trichlorobacter ammonificans]CAH2031704.1 LexA repressor [Trichlorobacter ammonificans]